MDIKLDPESVAEGQKGFWQNLVIVMVFSLMATVSSSMEFFWEPCADIACCALAFANATFYLIGFLIENPLVKKVAATIDFIVARVKEVMISCALLLMYLNLMEMGAPILWFWSFIFFAVYWSTYLVVRTVRECKRLAAWLTEKRERDSKLATALEQGNAEEAQAHVKSLPPGAIFDQGKIPRE